MWGWDQVVTTLCRRELMGIGLRCDRSGAAVTYYLWSRDHVVTGLVAP